VLIRPRPRFVFTFLRHGESVGNAEERLQGQKDYPLNDTGRAQARALAQRWKDEEVVFDKIFASPLARARETAQIIAAALEVPVEFDPIWMERAGGELQGLTASEMRQLPKPDFTNPYVPMGGSGEGDWALYLRGGQALHGLLLKPIGSYLVVSHGGLLNQVLHAAAGLTPHGDSGGARFRFENTAFARLFYFPSLHRWEFDALNDHTHWKTDPTLQE
jgi:broad specificity phosphatase PhoE